MAQHLNVLIGHSSASSSRRSSGRTDVCDVFALAKRGSRISGFGGRWTVICLDLRREINTRR
jgi:hypothetical protein